MAHPLATPHQLADAIPAPVHRAAAQTVTRALVPACLVLLALAILEVVTSGELLLLQLAAVTVLVVVMPGTLIATEAVARYRIDGTLRRMERDLQASGGPSA